jgi:hypothetical protein
LYACSFSRNVVGQTRQTPATLKKPHRTRFDQAVSYETRSSAAASFSVIARSPMSGTTAMLAPGL